MSRGICSIPGCGKAHEARGFCQAHYCQKRYSGELKLLPKRTMEERFWSHVDQSAGPDSCWPWMGTRTAYGYGIYQPTRSGYRHAHRIAYEIATSEPLGKLQADHLCHNTICCNPKHLRPATNKQNGEHLKGAHKNSRSGIRGVYWNESRRRWMAQVKHNGKIWAAAFTSINDAEQAVIDKRLELFTHSDMDKRGV